VREEVGVGNRPAAAGDPWPLFEVYGVERHASAAPRDGGATECPPAALFQWLVRVGLVRYTPVKVAVPAPLPLLAAGQQHSRDVIAAQFECKREPGGSSSDNTYIRRDTCVGINTIRVDNHLGLVLVPDRCQSWVVPPPGSVADGGSAAGTI
jgi:hypothetical protein